MLIPHLLYVDTLKLEMLLNFYQDVNIKKIHMKEGGGAKMNCWMSRNLSISLIDPWFLLCFFLLSLVSQPYKQPFG